MIIQVDNVLVASDIITDFFCCDLDKCHGICCVEGDSGAPVTADEVMELENILDDVWPQLSASAQATIDHQGVAYNDSEGDLVTSIVHGKDCVFTYHENKCCYCATEKLFIEGKSKWCKPISCALYPIREKTLKNGTTALNYNRWDVCRPAVEKGKQLKLPIYKFLKDPLIRRFGEVWYSHLEETAQELIKQNIV